jgi:hypothetical protein
LKASLAVQRQQARRAGARRKRVRLQEERGLQRRAVEARREELGVEAREGHVGRLLEPLDRDELRPSRVARRPQVVEPVEADALLTARDTISHEMPVEGLGDVGPALVQLAARRAQELDQRRRRSTRGRAAGARGARPAGLERDGARPRLAVDDLELEAAR